MGLGTIRLAGRFLRGLPGPLCVDLGAHDLATPDNLSRLGAHDCALHRHRCQFAIHDTLRYRASGTLPIGQVAVTAGKCPNVLQIGTSFFAQSF